MFNLISEIEILTFMKPIINKRIDTHNFIALVQDLYEKEKVSRWKNLGNIKIINVERASKGTR